MKIDKKVQIGDQGVSMEEAQEASQAMDCIGWLTVHGFTLTFHPDGLQIQPESVPVEIVQVLMDCQKGLDLIFPDHQLTPGRVLGGSRREEN